MTCAAAQSSGRKEKPVTANALTVTGEQTVCCLPKPVCYHRPMNFRYFSGEMSKNSLKALLK